MNGPGTAAPQPLVGYRTNAEWIALLDEVNEQIAGLEAIPEGQREQVFGLLQSVDAVHREALHRLVRLFKEGVAEQVVTDPAIHTLFGMYDLLPAEAPGCAKVWDFMGDAPPPRDLAPAIAATTADQPHWSPAPVLRAPAPGEALLCRMDEGTIVLAHAADALHALDAHCPVHDAPMVGGRLSGVSWICPHGPGCIYDVRNGARLGGAGGLACHPVRAEAGGRILIGFGIPHRPGMPAF